MFKKWNISQAVISPDSEIITEFGPFLGGIMLRRGMTSVSALACGGLSDPFLLTDMRRAANIINEALEEGKKITVFGDYDCDGISSTAILYNYLEAQGAEVDYYIPDRMKEGYGMNLGAVEKLAERGTELVITVDNGISAIQEAHYLVEKGVKLVITDHHQPHDTLPECDACVDPHRSDDISPYKELCGAGLVLKLLIALELSMGGDAETILDRYSDIAALATIADIVPLTGENRYIVQRGFRNIKNRQNAGLTKLIEAAGKSTSDITSSDLAFCIAPRINAAGRIDDTDKAVRILLCTEAEDMETARTLSEQLSAVNAERQRMSDAIYTDARGLIENDPMLTKQRVIVLAKAGWHPGLIGIACAKLLEEYGKPVIMISVDGDSAHGSMRSIEGFPAHRLLAACSSVLTKSGGHPGAGGFSLPTDKIGEFTRMVHEYCRSEYPKMPVLQVCADMDVSMSDLTVENISSLSLLEPFGEGNSVPLFRLRDCAVSNVKPRKDGKFTSFYVRSGGASFPVISFDIRYDDFLPTDGDRIDLIVSASINEYENRRNVQLRLVDYHFSGFNEDKYFAALRVYEEICRGEGCDERLLPRVIPQDRDELKVIYDMVKAHKGKTAEELFMMNGSINYCKLRVALDAFADAGMVTVAANGACELADGAGRQDMFAPGGYLDRLGRSLK